MKIKTYTARDMRSALRMVRDEQGPDAVILSTRHLPEGVVVTVAVDFGLKYLNGDLYTGETQP